MKHWMRVALQAGLATSCLVPVHAVHAQSAYPTKAVRLVSQFPPGGGTDIVARLFAPKLSEALGQQFIVENRVGAAGNIGADFVAKSPADGYILLVGNNTIVTNPAVQKTPFDVVKDFEPIAIVGATPVALVVHPSVPAKTLRDFIALAKKEGRGLTYSSCGTGTAMHLAAELLQREANIEMTHVPYKGCGPAIPDGIGGQVPVLFNTITNTYAQAQGGRLRIIALASATRSPVDNTLPTIAESGFAGFDADIWFGFLAPVGTPREIVTRLNTELNRIVQLPEIQQRMRTQLFSTRTSTPEEFSKIIQADLTKWSKLVRDANIKVEF
jgi:tripartite-type tricarboxylate transporter receptor subunit TctC